MISIQDFSQKGGSGSWKRKDEDVWLRLFMPVQRLQQGFDGVLNSHSLPVTHCKLRKAQRHEYLVLDLYNLFPVGSHGNEFDGNLKLFFQEGNILLKLWWELFFRTYTSQIGIPTWNLCKYRFHLCI